MFRAIISEMRGNISNAKYKLQTILQILVSGYALVTILMEPKTGSQNEEKMKSPINILLLHTKFLNVIKIINKRQRNSEKNDFPANIQKERICLLSHLHN